MDTYEQSSSVKQSDPPFGGKVFEQYQLLIEESARISDRRHSTNNLFLSVNSILLGAVALLIQQSTGRDEGLLLFLAFLLVAAGVVLSIFWYRFLMEYSERLRRRFAYLTNLERTHPTLLFPVYSTILTDQSFTHMEARIPQVFIATYFVAVIGVIVYILDLLPRVLSILRL